MINLVDNSVISDNPEIASLVCSLLPSHKNIALPYEVSTAMFDTNNPVQKKLHLLNLHFGKLDKVQIETLASKLGENYGKLYMKQHKPVFIITRQT